METTPAVLIAAPKSDTGTPRAAAALAAVREAFPVAGVYQAADAARGRGVTTGQIDTFAAVVIVEASDRTLSRGCYQIAEAALAAARPVYVLRGGGSLAGRGRLVPVIGVLPLNRASYASGYGRAIASPHLAPIVAGPSHTPDPAALIAA